MQEARHTDALAIADHCRDTLPLTNATLASEYGYNHLPLCVIDAVFSINARYTSVRNVIRRYCSFCSLADPFAQSPESHTDVELSIHELSQQIESFGIERFATDVLQNRQRTSTRSGILKADAVYRFTAVLTSHGVDTLADFRSLLSIENIEHGVRLIPGQASGVSWRYFLMLTGDDDHIKPDRVILRFLSEILGRTVHIDEAQTLLCQASEILRKEYDWMTPRLLDNTIWKHRTAGPDVV